MRLIPTRWSGRSRRLTSKQQTGAVAERQALHHLKKHGLRLIARNFSCRSGELDLVMTDNSCTVVVEVRARAPNARVPALLTVDDIKQGKIIRATEVWLANNEQYADIPVRFDIVTIDSGQHGRAELQWFKDAFRA